MNVKTYKLLNRADCLQNSFLIDENVELGTSKEAFGANSQSGS